MKQPIQSKSETAFGAAFLKAGLTPLRAEWRQVLARYHNNGLTLEEIAADVAALADNVGWVFVYELEPATGDHASFADEARRAVSPSGGAAEGQATGVDETKAHVPSAATPSAGQCLTASQEATLKVPAASTAGEDHARRAEKAPHQVSSPAVDPSPGYVDAAIRARTQAAKSIFDRKVLPDGMPVGDLRPSQAARLNRESRFWAHFADAIMARGVWPNDNPLRVQMSVKEMESFIEQAQRDAFYSEH